MTTPDTPTLIRDLRQAINGMSDHIGQEIAAISERLRGHTLITLPPPNDPDRWYCEAFTVEAGQGVVLIDGTPVMVTDARELGLALLAAVARIEATP